MPKVKTTPPEPSRTKGQHSLDIPDYLQRFVPYWGRPDWYDAKMWRNTVLRQPIAVACREHLVSRLCALDWKIEPRDSRMRDELQDEIRYYTAFLNYTGEYDYVDILEWIVQDLLDIPFGGACEVGREGDSEMGRVLWIQLLDGGTLFPTLNYGFPVGQYVPEAQKTVYFPHHAINRVYLSPRTDIHREGWGMAPPEKIYLAIELLNRGDEYYAKLLLDTPEAGILDLGDMEKESAKEWLDSWRSLLGGIDPYKIPVLYEHSTPANFIQFSRSPNDLMFDKATFKYASLIAAGYGITLNDLGLAATSGGGGDTLAGSIRSERITRRSGFARLKRKIKYFFDRLILPALELKFIDLDDEFSVALGRARLASATAIVQDIQSGMITPEEGRLQQIADGLFTISMPEHLPKEAVPSETVNTPERPGLLGNPISPSQGGYGEIRSRIDDEIDRIFSPEDARIRKLARQIIQPISTELSSAMAEFQTQSELDAWNEAVIANLYVFDSEDVETRVIYLNMLRDILKNSLDKETWWKLSLSDAEFIEDFIDIFMNERAEIIRKRSEIAYERGEKPDLDFEVPEPDGSFIGLCETSLGRLYNKTTELITSYLADAVISGVRNYCIIHAPNTDIDPDTIDVQMVSAIRSALYESKLKFIYKLADDFRQTLNNVMESVK